MKFRPLHDRVVVAQIPSAAPFGRRAQECRRAHVILARMRSSQSSSLDTSISTRGDYRHDHRIRSAALHPALRPPRDVPEEHVRLDGLADRRADSEDRRHEAGDLRRLEGGLGRRRSQGRSRHPGGRAVRRRHPPRRGQARLRHGVPGREERPGRIRLRVRRRLRPPHRGLPADLLQGPGALQPRGRFRR